MKEEVIKKLTVIAGSGVRTFEVGVDGVESIIDRGTELETEMYLLYIIYGENEKVLSKVENCPVVLDLKDKQ